MPFSSRAWPSTCTRSSSRTPSRSAACAAPARRKKASDLKTILHAAAADRGPRAARGVALHVHRYRVHGDVRRGGLDMHGEGRRIAAEALGSDAEQVHRFAESLLELRALRILAARAERPGGGDLGEVHAEIRRAADADADDGRRAGLAARLEHAIDHERLHRIDALGRNGHAQPRVVFGAGAL